MFWCVYFLRCLYSNELFFVALIKFDNETIVKTAYIVIHSVSKIMYIDWNLTINATIKLACNGRAANRYAINGSGFSTCIDMTNGKAFTLQSDHKPLISLLGSSKTISELPPRIQRFRMRLMRFKYDIVHVPGKDMWTADALSRAPQATQSEADLLFQEETDIYMCSVVDSYPTTPTRMDQIRIQQEGDEVCQTLVHYSNNGWPTKSQLAASVQQYWQYRGELLVN